MKILIINYSIINLTGLDGQRIIIYGGYFNDPGYLDNSLYVLDSNFNWYISKTTGNIPRPDPEFGIKQMLLKNIWLCHLINIIFYILWFKQINYFNKNRSTLIGCGCDKSVESDILLLDISNNEEYIWTTIFDPPDSNVIIPPSLSSNSSLPSSHHHYLHHHLHQ
ncbi:unnamed protein product [Rhizophagus irregularis]|nr:unnamed protein product [Rhizophagus irregularis]